MRIPCPHCGERGSEEFTYRGEAGLVRPGADASPAAWHDYVYLRKNPAGPHAELWQHLYGCRRWLTVTRDTRTHAILDVQDAAPQQVAFADDAPGDAPGGAPDGAPGNVPGSIQVTT